MDKLMKKSINVTCLGEDCPTPCCDNYSPIQENLVSLYKHEFLELPITEEKKKELEEKGYEDKVYYDENIKMNFIKLNEDGSCPFFEDGSCGIGVFEEDLFDVKDTGVPVCAAYPFYIDLFAGLCVDSFCPGVGEGWKDVRGIKKKLKALEKAYRLYFDSIDLLQKGELETSSEYIKDGKINFSCLGDDCPSSCCGAYEGIDPDLVSVYGHGFSDIPISDGKKKILVDELGYEEEVYFDHDSDLYYIKLNEDKSCPFFRNGLCTIHGVAPSLCDAYPFYLDPFAGLCMDTSCPGVGNGWTEISELEEEFESLKKSYELRFSALESL